MSDPHHKPLPLGLIVTAATILILVAYPLSIGPAARIVNSPRCPNWLEESLVVVYAPLEWICDNGPEWGRDLLQSYAGWWLNEPAPPPSY